MSLDFPQQLSQVRSCFTCHASSDLSQSRHRGKGTPLSMPGSRTYVRTGQCIAGMVPSRRCRRDPPSCLACACPPTAAGPASERTGRQEVREVELSRRGDRDA
eukprot:3541743-Rhodomonas_salina.1